MALKNQTSGPRYVNTTKGAVLLQPGQSLPDDAEVSGDEMAAIEATGFLGGGDGDGSQIVDPAIGNRSTDVAASMNLGSLGTPNSGPAGEVTAEQLKDENTEAQLREIADTEGADLSGTTDKLSIAQAIIDNRAK